MNNRKAAEVFPPGEFIKEELEARNWTQTELAEIIGRQSCIISELISAKRIISPDLAKELGAAFDTSPEFWMNIENTYQLWKAKDTDKAISQRSKIYQFAPVKEMIRRNWIEPSENVEVLTKRVAQFFEIKDLNHSINFAHAARKKTDEVTSSHKAWFYRAKHLAKCIHVNTFSDRTFTDGLEKLKTLLPNSQDIRHVPKILAESGIRFLVVEHLPHTKIDGVTFWLDAKSPVIVLSMRIDRVDGFWFTLAHELAHVSRRDGLDARRPPIFDNDLVRDGEDFIEDRTEAEIEADSFAIKYLINETELENFILRIRPLYGRQKIINFAKRIEVHPAIVVGQLHHRGEIPYRNFRPMLEKVKNIITSAALTDGWGFTPILKEA